MVSVGRSKTDSSENRENGFGQSALFLDDRIADDGERSPNTSLWCAASFPLPSGFQRHLMRQAVRRVAADWVLVRLRSCFSIRLIYARTHERCQLKISRSANETSAHTPAGCRPLSGPAADCERPGCPAVYCNATRGDFERAQRAASQLRRDLPRRGS